MIAMTPQVLQQAPCRPEIPVLHPVRQPQAGAAHHRGQLLCRPRYSCDTIRGSPSTRADSNR
jgi:hypothetical protein